MIRDFRLNNVLRFIVTGYLYHLTTFLLSSLSMRDGVSVNRHDILRTITKPLTELIVQVHTLLSN